ARARRGWRRGPWRGYGRSRAPPPAARRHAPPPARARRETRGSPGRGLGRRSRQLLADDLVHQLAIRPPFELGHDLAHDLPEILGPGCDRRAHRGADLVGRDCRGEELLQHFHLGQLRRRAVAALRLVVRLGGLPPPLDTAAQNLGRLLVGGRMAQLDFSVANVGEDGREKQGARLIASFSRLVHRGAQPLRQTRHDSGVARAAGFAPPRVHLALAALARLLVVAVLAQVRQDARLLTLLLEALQ